MVTFPKTEPQLHKRSMDKNYNHKEYEEKIYSQWEKADVFKTSQNGEPYTILMPPPNANASLHAGHAMYTVDDILIRFRRMQGFSVSWIPGLDHAGFETQYVYEKNLAKEGKSRMDFDRETLYKNIFSFVKDNSGLIYGQMKKLGFSADWNRSVFTLDDNVVETVYQTFSKMEKEGYVYRDNYIVNYCTNCGTSLAELEVKYVERVDPLYFVKYPLEDGSGFITVATVRPEPIFVDTHLAVNPKDQKNKHLIGKKVLNPLTDAVMEIIADDYVDPEFGTGIVKLTPAHDANDFQVAKKHNLPIITAIDWRGKITANGGKYAGMKAKIAREEVVKDLEAKGLIEKIDSNYIHNVTTCYKCGRDLENLTIPNWFIKVKDLKQKVKEVVEKDEIKFTPKRFKKHMLTWLETMHDWPISRQIVWGIRIPAWYAVDKNPDLQITFLDKNTKPTSGKLSELINKYTFEEIESGLQFISAPHNSVYEISTTKPGANYLQETDTFDTWFSSGQWPLVTLKDQEFETRFPTNFMGTLSDILKFWVSRMIMFSLYLKQEIPFKNVYLWSMVADSKGVKMSKSKGNVVNPLELIDKYGADALRMSLMYGTPAGSKVILSDDKVKGMRNFANKIWNIARFVKQNEEVSKAQSSPTHNSDDKLILGELQKTTQKVTGSLEKYQLNEAAEEIYDFLWHKFADVYIEKTKDRREEAQPVLQEVLEQSLKLLHPFMPFVTEAIWQEMGNEDLLIASKWPEA